MNKKRILVFLALVLPAVSCINFNKKTIFRPEPGQETDPVVQTNEVSGRIIETERTDIPEWVSAIINEDTRHIEGLALYRDRYVFIGKNRGTNLLALRQWADNFSAILDFPQLAAERIEKRLIAAASLYPDDEYGEYFENLIKNATDAEYPPVLKEETFWVKRQYEYMSAPDTETENETVLMENRDIYEFFVLLSINKTALQAHIRRLLTGVKTAVPPTRAQNAAISRVRQNFFEGF